MPAAAMLARLQGLQAMVQAGNDETLVRTEQFKTWAMATGKDVCSLMAWALTVLDDENDPVNDGFTVRR